MSEAMPLPAPGTWRAVLDALPAHVAVLDAQGGIVAVNAAWHRFACENGWPAGAEMAGADYLQTCEAAARDGADGAAEALAGLRDVLAGTRDHFSLVYPCHAPGRERWFRMEVSPLPAAKGGGAVVQHVDVTRGRKLEARLRAAQRFEVVAQLTASLAHDFNNVLTVVEGNAELLRERLATRPDDELLANMVVEAARRGAGLAQHLLAFARRQAPEPRRVPVTPLLRGLERMARRVLGDEITLVVMADDACGDVLADPAQLENALLGLCLAAREAMPAGGQLALAADALVTTPRDLDPGRKPAQGEYVRIEVVDSGEGLGRDELARIMGAAAGEHPTGGGNSGFGMAYGVVRAEGGFMELRSEPGRGTSVSLYLPRLPAAPEPALEPGDDEAPRGRERILLVEDDPLVRNYAYGLLTALGYSVVVTGSGEEALDVLSGPEGFDLLFTDVMMPGGMNGVQLAGRARALRPGLKVLFCSGYPASVLTGDGRLPVGEVMLAKPYRKQALATCLRQVLSAETGDQ